MDEAKQQVNMGVIEIDEAILKHEPFTSIFPKLLNTQGKPWDKDVFTDLHDQLLLPESYVISAVMQHLLFERLWQIAVYSPDIPLPDYTDPFHDYTVVKPSYSVHINQEDGTRTPYLEKITFYPRRTA